MPIAKEAYIYGLPRAQAAACGAADDFLLRESSRRQILEWTLHQGGTLQM